jgi:hypothetical protein
MKHEESMHDLSHPPLTIPAGTRMVAGVAVRDAAGLVSSLFPCGWIWASIRSRNLISMRLEGIAPRAVLKKVDLLFVVAAAPQPQTT